MIILWITGIVFIGTQIVLVWAAYRFADELDAQGKPVRQAAVLPRQPAARGDLDDHSGGHPGLHRALSDGDLGRASSSAAPPPRCPPLAEITARQFQWVMRYPGPDGKLNTPRRPVHRQRPALRQEQAGTDLSEVVRRAPLVLPAAAADQAGRRAGHDDPGLVRLPTRPASTSWSAPSCAAGAITRCAARSRSMRRKRNFRSGSTSQLAEQNRSQLTMATGPEGR